LEFIGSALGQEGICPDRSTGRLWLLRIGLAALLRPKAIAADWVWMIDHSVQIGQCKCLVILGIRLSEFPKGRPLCHQDMEPLALVPMIGIVQVGTQSLADRYSYIPIIGIWMALCAGIAQLVKQWRPAPIWWCAGGAVLISVMLTRQQITYWQDNSSVWRPSCRTCPRVDGLSF
jgi:hypothetical protein